MGALTSRQHAGVEEVDIPSNSVYRYPPKSGEGRARARRGPGGGEAARRMLRASGAAVRAAPSRPQSGGGLPAAGRGVPLIAGPCDAVRRAAGACGGHRGHPPPGT